MAEKRILYDDISGIYLGLNDARGRTALLRSALESALQDGKAIQHESLHGMFLVLCDVDDSLGELLDASDTLSVSAA